MHGEYQALLDKVTAFTEAVWARSAGAMVCRAGCESCCHVWLALSTVEADAMREALRALPASVRGAIAERGALQLKREANADAEPRCAMLQPDGCCAVYAVRPLVCRTQGFALRYPSGVITPGAIRKRLANGEASACNLNFERGMPPDRDILDAERIDQLLGLVNARFCQTRSRDAEERHPISAIASECDVLACHEDCL